MSRKSVVNKELKYINLLQQYNRPITDEIDWFYNQIYAYIFIPLWVMNVLCIMKNIRCCSCKNDSKSKRIFIKWPSVWSFFLLKCTRNLPQIPDILCYHFISQQGTSIRTVFIAKTKISPFLKSYLSIPCGNNVKIRISLLITIKNE